MLFIKKVRLIISLFNSSDKLKLAGIFLISVLNGLACTGSIAAMLPFIGLISQPELMDSNEFILAFRRITNINSYGGVVISFGGISLFLLIFGSVLNALDDWYGQLFGSKKEQFFSARLLKYYLGSDVLEFNKKNSGERVKEILLDVERVIISTLYSMMDLLAEIIMCGCVLTLLLWFDWRVTLLVFSVLSVVYILINSFTSKKLQRLGEEHAALDSTIYNHVLESLKLQKEIKLNDVPDIFVDRYYKSVGNMVRNGLHRSLISDLPQYILEIVGFGTLLVVAIYYVLNSTSDSPPVTVIGMYAVAAYRLMPSIAGIFDRIEDIWFDSAVLESLVHKLTAGQDGDVAVDEEVSRYSYETSIALRNISFRYLDGGVFLLNSLSLEFPVNKMTCIKGRTGCGKSTVLSLIAGLYYPNAGSVLADGKVINAYASKQWKLQIGFVPPVINVLHATLLENIALGVPVGEINRKKVHELCELVDLDSHIQSLSKKYDSVCGKDGLSFSSGQLQKIGLARALYREPSLLLLDESTDAFDLNTEKLVLTRLKGMAGMTIIFVSHRPSVMDMADCVLDLEEEFGVKS